MTRVALDIMGGDHGPEVRVAAALNAIRNHGIAVTLVGNESTIRRLIASSNDYSGRLSIIDAPETVSMEDAAVSAVRRKQRASIPIGLELLKSGDVDAFVSAGNTGAVVASAVVSLGRLSGVGRPGIAIPIPTQNASLAILIDAGAITDPRPEHVWQHARLAAAYAALKLGIDSPRVGLVSNGEESSKGNSLSRAVFALLEADEEINFVGNIESRSIATGESHVLVTDGFTGNVILKTAEGIAGLLQDTLRHEFRSRWYTAILASMLRPAFHRAGRKLDYREYGGAPLLGLNGLVYIAHGRSDELALVRAIQEAHRNAEDGMLERLEQAL